MEELEENQEKQKKTSSIVVKIDVFDRLHKYLHHNGLSTMNSVISYLLDNLEKKDG